MSTKRSSGGLRCPGPSVSSSGGSRAVTGALAVAGLAFLGTIVSLMIVAVGREARAVARQAAELSAFDARLVAGNVGRSIAVGDALLRTGVRAAAAQGAFGPEAAIDHLDEVLLQELLLAPEVSGVALMGSGGLPVWRSSPFQVSDDDMAVLTTTVIENGYPFDSHVMEISRAGENTLLLSRLTPGASLLDSSVAFAELDGSAFIQDSDVRPDGFVTNAVVSDERGRVLAALCRSARAPCAAQRPPDGGELSRGTLVLNGERWSGTSLRVGGTSLWVTAYTDFTAVRASNQRRTRVLFFLGLTLGLVTWALGMILRRQQVRAERSKNHHIMVLDRANAELRRLSTDRELLVKEVHHRVKNNLGMIESILRLTAADAGEDARELLSDIGARIEAIRGVHDALYRSEEVTRSVGLDSYLPNLVETIVGSLCPFPVRLKFQLPAVEIAARPAIALGIITAEVTTNAIKYGLQPDSEYEVHAERAGLLLRIAFSNSGKPYPERSMPGLGTELIQQLTEQLGGTVTVRSTDRTTVQIELPVDGCMEQEKGF